MRPVLKKVFALRYIGSLGQENHGCLADKPFENVHLPNGKYRLSRPVGTSNFRGLISVVYCFHFFYNINTECNKKQAKMPTDVN